MRTCVWDFHAELTIFQMQFHANLCVSLKLLADDAGIYLHMLLAVSTAYNNHYASLRLILTLER